MAFVKKMIEENIDHEEIIYHTLHEKEFINKYMDFTGVKELLINKEEMTNCEQFTIKYPYLPNPLISEFYNDIYSSFRFIFEIEVILDQIVYDGLTLNRAEDLMNLCCLLSISSSNAMIAIDDDFSFQKKYSLAEDIYIMAKNMYNYQMLIHTSFQTKFPRNDLASLTSYDEIDSRLSCKYIRSGIAVLKLFHILAILEISPTYSNGVHKIAKSLIQLLREVLYNKRIVNLIVDNDTQGLNPKAHKTTRVKIYFTMSNSDRYCIRLDFPHDGENNLHLNLNEPAKKQSSGFPFNGKEFIEAMGICKDKDIFDKLFYFKDDLFWFRSNYAQQITTIGKTNKELEESLKQFQHKRGHIQLLESTQENKKSVSEFSIALAEAVTEYAEILVYGSTDSEDDELYKYVLFQDFIFDIIIHLKAYELSSNISRDSNNSFSAESDGLDNLKAIFCTYIKDNFSNDDVLISYTTDDGTFCDLIARCLDHLDRNQI